MKKLFKVSSIAIFLLLQSSLFVHSQGLEFLWSGAATLTGQGLIKKLRDAANGIVDNVGNEARATANSVSAELNKNADNLERILGNNVNKPITELRQTFEVEIERSLVALNQTQIFLNSFRSCFKGDLKELLSALSGTLTYNISEAVPWASGRSIIMNVRKIGTESILGIRSSKEHQILEITGANFIHNARCQAEVVVENLTSKKKIDSHIVTISPTAVTVEIPPIAVTGVYRLMLSFRKRNIFGCKDPEHAEATFVVLPEAKFSFSYNLTPSCSVKQTIAFNAGKLDGTNDACDGDRIFSQNFVLPSEWKYTSHDWHVTSLNGCEGNATYSGGNMVSVSYRCPERGGIFCTGTRKWVHGEMVIHGEKSTSQAGSPIAAEIPNSLKFSQSITVNPVIANNCSLDGTWTVSVSVVFPDGTRFDIPTKTGSGPLTSSSNGATFSWNPSTFALTVSAPPSNCGEY